LSVNISERRDVYKLSTEGCERGYKVNKKTKKKHMSLKMLVILEDVVRNYVLWSSKRHCCGMSVFTATTTYNFVAGRRKLFQAGCACWIPGGAFCIAVSWLAVKIGVL
jgi:hypothetical protein